MNIKLITIQTIGGPKERKWRIDYIIDIASSLKRIIEYKDLNGEEKLYEITVPLLNSEKLVEDYSNRLELFKERECKESSYLSDIEVKVEIVNDVTKESYHGNLFDGKDYIDTLTFNLVDLIFNDTYKLTLQNLNRNSYNLSNC